MELNLKLIREILLYIENSKNDNISVYDMKIRNYTVEEISYHCNLLLDKEYIIAYFNRFLNGRELVVKRMTMQGHEYLNSIRDETIWNQTLEKIKSVGSSMTLSMVQTLANAIAMKTLGI